MGFDVLHMNLHKTFATPHGGGGPVLVPSGRSSFVALFADPIVGCEMTAEGPYYRWLDEQDLPDTIGPLSAHMGNAGILLRAFAYSRLLGAEGMRRVGEFATLNANYMAARLKAAGLSSLSQSDGQPMNSL